METVLLGEGIKPTVSTSTLLLLAWEHGTGKGCVLGLISTDANSGHRGLLGLEEYTVGLPCACSLLASFPKWPARGGCQKPGAEPGGPLRLLMQQLLIQPASPRLVVTIAGNHSN